MRGRRFANSAFCHSPFFQARCVQELCSEPGWQVIEVATGHDPMISAPELLDILEQAGRSD